MVKYSDDTEYEQIELATMYDLRDARLVLAQIVSIDRANNCAEITIEESCEELAGKDLSAVPFFYHCENSTGTIGDLTRGHSAFKIEDYVYCLWAPQSSDIDERFYIVGHSDIHGIAKCGNEILYLKTAEQYDPASGYVYCLFDAGAGTLLDLENFTNLDADSPPKPESAIGVGSQDVDDWVAYNFVDVTPTVTVPYYSSYETYPAIGATSVTMDTLDETIYTGTQGFYSSSIPVTCSTFFTAGNGVYSGTASGSISEPSNLITGSHSIVKSRTSPFFAQVTDRDCRAAWRHQEEVVTTTYRSTDDFKTRLTLTDPTSLEEVSFGCSFSDMIRKESYSDLTTDGDLTAEVYAEQAITIVTHFGGFEQLNQTYEFNSSAVTTYSNSSSFAPWFTAGTYVRESGSGSYLIGKQNYIGESFAYPDVMGPSRPIFVGEFAAYCITGVSVYIEEYFNTDPNLSTGQDRLLNYIAMPGAGASITMYNSGFGDSQSQIHKVPDPPNPDIIVWHDREVKVFIAPFAFVAPFYDEFGADGSETIQTCFANTDPSRSVGLGEALQDTFDFFLAHVNTLGFEQDDYRDFYTYTVKPGIAETRIIKRKLE